MRITPSLSTLSRLHALLNTASGSLSEKAMHSPGTQGVLNPVHYPELRLYLLHSLEVLI